MLLARSPSSTTASGGTARLPPTPTKSWGEQFLSEAILLALGGGAVGVGVGALATAVYATTKGWAIVIPTSAWAGGFAAALLIGAVAGLLPAIRAARLAPADALRTV